FADEDEDAVTVKQPPNLFLNDGSGVFTDVAPADSALAHPRLGRGAAYADYDRDGDLDIVMTENGGPVHLFRNDTRSGARGPSFVRWKLEGRESNRDGIGAELRLYQREKMQRRYVRT